MRRKAICLSKSCCGRLCWENPICAVPQPEFRLCPFAPADPLAAAAPLNGINTLSLGIIIERFQWFTLISSVQASLAIHAPDGRMEREVGGVDNADRLRFSQNFEIIPAI